MENPKIDEPTHDECLIQKDTLTTSIRGCLEKIFMTIYFPKDKNKTSKNDLSRSIIFFTFVPEYQ